MLGVMSETHAPSPLRRFSYLGPAGTFTEAALAQVPQAQGQEWHPVNNVGEALGDVADGRSDGAMIAIENSVDGGVSVALDALATIPGVRVAGEYLVNVNFNLVARPGTAIADIRTVHAHPVAYGQSHVYLDDLLPGHGHIPATSNVAAAANLPMGAGADAAVAPPGIEKHHDVAVLATDIGSNSNAVTRFLLITRSTELPERTGADKTSVIAELPQNDPGALLRMLEQFGARGVNLSMIESRPIGDELGRYRFIMDLDGHIRDERVAEALLGLHRFCPKVSFLGSYPRADRTKIDVDPRFDDRVFISARQWLRGILAGAPIDE